MPSQLLGAYADLLLVDGNPLEDIKVVGELKNLRVIIKDGQVYKNTLTSWIRHIPGGITHNREASEGEEGYGKAAEYRRRTGRALD